MSMPFRLQRPELFMLRGQRFGQLTIPGNSTKSNCPECTECKSGMTLTLELRLLLGAEWARKKLIRKEVRRMAQGDKR